MIATATWTIFWGVVSVFGIIAIIYVVSMMVIDVISNWRKKRKDNPNWRQERDDE